MASDAKMGLLSGLVAVLLLSAVYFYKPMQGSPGAIPGQAANGPGKPSKKPGEEELLSPSAGSELDPVIHLPKPAPPPKDVLVRPMR